MGGMVGRLFREFAVTLSVAVALSLAGVPHHDAHDVRDVPRAARRPAARPAVPRERARVRGDAPAVRAEPLVGARAPAAGPRARPLATVALNVYLFVVVPKGFFPQQDTGRLRGRSRRPRTSRSRPWSGSWARSSTSCGAIPAVESVTGFTGGGPGGATRNTARLFIVLKPLDGAGARRRAGHRAAPRPARPGVRARRRSSRRSRTSASAARSSNAQYQYTLQGERVEELGAWARRLEQRLRATAAARRREQRPAGQGAPDLARHRPEHGLAARHHAAADRRHALRRVRPAAGRRSSTRR